jgi:hypothetical protein
MAKTIASGVFLIDSLVIGLGAFGHGSQAGHLHSAIDGFPIESNIHSMLFVVWYFVSGCMLAFGAILVWAWRRMRAGDRQPLVPALLIGVLYAGIGVFGLIYRQGDPFMGFFLALGVLLLISGPAMAPPATARAR